MQPSVSDKRNVTHEPLIHCNVDALRCRRAHVTKQLVIQLKQEIAGCFKHIERVTAPGVIHQLQPVNFINYVGHVFRSLPVCPTSMTYRYREAQFDVI